jgi:hypothetical protein
MVIVTSGWNNVRYSFSTAQSQPTGESQTRARNCTESVPTKCTSRAKIPLVIPCKFSAVTNSARRSCARLAASQPMPDSWGIKGLRTRPKCGPEWRGAPKSGNAVCYTEASCSGPSQLGSSFVASAATSLPSGHRRGVRLPRTRSTFVALLQYASH